MRSLFLVTLLALTVGVGHAASVDDCDVRIELTAQSFDDISTVQLEVESEKNRDIYVEIGLRVQRQIEGVWSGPELLPWEWWIIRRIDLGKPDLIARMWKDVAVKESSESYTVEPGTYRFYLRYFLEKPDWKERLPVCVAISDQFTLESPKSRTQFR